MFRSKLDVIIAVCFVATMGAVLGGLFMLSHHLIPGSILGVLAEIWVLSLFSLALGFWAACFAIRITHMVYEDFDTFQAMALTTYALMCIIVGISALISGLEKFFDPSCSILEPYLRLIVGGVLGGVGIWLFQVIASKNTTIKEVLEHDRQCS